MKEYKSSQTLTFGIKTNTITVHYPCCDEDCEYYSVNTCDLFGVPLDYVQVTDGEQRTLRANECLKSEQPREK